MVIMDMLGRAGIQWEAQGNAIEVRDGYPYFYSVFDFDEDGALTRVSAWE